MEERFNLSEKLTLESPHSQVILDVKEFIERLKESVIIVLKPRALCENRDFREIEGLNNEIDKLAGEKLI